jgi:hypothetical protein
MSCSRMSCKCSSKLLRTDALSSPTPFPPGPPPGADDADDAAADDADAPAGLMASSLPFAFLTAGVEGTSSSAPSAPRLTSGQMQYKSEARKHVSQQSRTSRSVLYPSALHGPSGHSQDSGPRILEPRQWGETDLDIGTHRTTQSAGLPTQAVAAARAERRRWGRSRWGGGPLTSKNASSDAAIAN